MKITLLSLVVVWLGGFHLAAAVPDRKRVCQEEAFGGAKAHVF
jgi:hypothetical protein